VNRVKNKFHMRRRSSRARVTVSSSPLNIGNVTRAANDSVTDLVNALPGNSSVNMNTSNNRRETVFSMRFTPG
jgi:hypothetical protein